MKILYYNCFAGISGDMNLGAMLDLGVPLEHLKAELQKLGIEGYELNILSEQRQGIQGTRCDVAAEETHHHRGLSDIEKIISESSLSDPVKEVSLRIFRKLAEAEAAVHGVNVEKIHFHEVGAVDAIVDIVGASICVEYLKPDLICSSPVELGGGLVECAHGKFPVPAPATVELLKGIPVTSGAVDYEATTPTGAAIISSLAEEFAMASSFVINKTAYGIGFKDTASLPNVLRVCLAERAESELLEETGQVIIESNIDDMNPEYYDHVFELLFKAGAKDVFMTPIIMKKSRPAITLSVLCHSEDEQRIQDIILTETSTIGVRKYPVSKSVLERKTETIATEYGEVRVKSAYYKGRKIKHKPEHDDCRRIAQENDIPLSEVYALIERLTNE